MKKQKKLSSFTSPSLPKSKNAASMGDLTKPFIIINPYIEQLKHEYRRRDRLSTSVAGSKKPQLQIESILDLIDKAQLSFLIDLGKKIGLEDYQEFIYSLKLVSRAQGSMIIERGKKPSYFFVLIEGETSYNTEPETKDELECVGIGKPGSLIYPEVFMTPKLVNFTIKCETNCSFLVFSEETYVKYIKKMLLRETETTVDFLNQTTLLDGLGSLNIRKYLPYFIPKTYKYNEIIYEQGTEAEFIEIIIEGEVELFLKKNNKSLGIVKLSKAQCFGIDCNSSSLRKYDAKSMQSKTKVLSLNVKILNLIRMENEVVATNFSLMVEKVERIHNEMMSKNLRVLTNEVKPGLRKKKKKLKGKKKENVTEFRWWGLAENVKIEHKYRITTQPKLNTTCSKKTKTADDMHSPRTLFTHKIEDLKRRVLENDLEEYEGECHESENQENQGKSWATTNYAPKMKKKIKMLETKPKAINIVESVRKKLLNYAHNMGTFCDRLNLE